MCHTHVAGDLEGSGRIFRDKEEVCKRNHVGAHVAVARGDRALGKELYLRYHFLLKLKSHDTA